MTDDRKKPIWPWIVSLLIGLPVLYVASFGPACWIAADPHPIGHPLRSSTPPRLMTVYWPLGSVAAKRSRLSFWLQWWMYVGAKKGSTVCVPTDTGGNCFAMSQSGPSL
jgi:hypothetical protein